MNGRTRRHVFVMCLNRINESRMKFTRDSQVCCIVAYSRLHLDVEREEMIFFSRVIRECMVDRQMWSDNFC